MARLRTAAQPEGGLMGWIDLGLALAGAPVLAASMYLAVLALMARRHRSWPEGKPHLKFDLIVPAHDEEQNIRATVENLSRLDYPRSLFRIRVVADNCQDRTAECAAAAGAEVIVRTDAQQRGKGYALAHAFALSMNDGFADAVLVIDADSVVTRNLLTACASRFDAGAAAIQVDYGVRNPLASWRTRMMTIALSAYHGVRSMARERMRLSCGLRGNGMAFSTALLRSVPHAAFSIVEDVEYGLQLGRTGVRVWYVGEARVLGQMVTTEFGSRSQRDRWERGRKTLARTHAPALLALAWRRRDAVLLDLGLDLLVPPLGELVAASALGLVVSMFLSPYGVRVAVWVWGISFAAQALYVMRGWALSGLGMSGLLDLLWAPVYIVWKLSLRLRGRHRKSGEWVRTTREVRM
jgi:1,2-diacylglycerol 3-beta-glucosyltransferase